jgi:hypothetical protein
MLANAMRPVETVLTGLAIAGILAAVLNVMTIIL